MDKNDISLSSLQIKLDQLGITGGGGGTPPLLEDNFFVGDSNNQPVNKDVVETKAILGISNVSDTTLNTKADTTYVNTQLNTKADTTYVNTQLNTKANTTDVNTQLNTKIDKVPNPTPNNIAIIDSEGQIVDSGIDTVTLKDGWDGEVNTYADLPTPSNNNGKKYVVKTPSGVIGINKKYAGTYISDGSAWNIFGYKQNSVINQPLTGYTIASSTSDLNSADTILNAFEKLQKQNKDINASNITNGTLNKDRLPSEINETALNDNKIKFRSSSDNNNYIQYNTSNSSLDFNSSDKIRFNSHALFEGAQNYSLLSYAYYNSAASVGIHANASPQLYDYSAYFNSRILVNGEVNVISDKRIKNIIKKSNSKTDLENLLKIEITDYTLKSDFTYKIHKKVIAQQIEPILPYAVSNSKNYTNDIEYQAKCIKNKIFIDSKKFDLKINDKIKILDEKDLIKDTILEIKENYIIISKELKSNNCVIIGKLVNDFKSVDYDSLTTLAVSSIQELHKEISLLKKEISFLKRNNNE